MVRVVGLGAGGHAKVVMEILRLVGEYELVGLLDPRQELWGTRVSEVPVLGDDRLLSDLHAGGVDHAFIGLGAVGDTRPRKRLYQRTLGQGFQVVQAIHPQAVIASSVRIGAGPTVMACTVINPDARLGDNVIINSGAIVEHDCWIGDHVHVAIGARLAGAVHVSEGAFVGAGAVVRQRIRLGRNVIVAAGAVVVDDVPDSVLVAGVPARVLKELEA